MKTKIKTKKFVKSKTTRKEIMNFIDVNKINKYCIYESSIHYELHFK